MLALYDYGSPDVFVFLNGQIAQLTGMGIGIVCMSVFRQMDLEIQACWLEHIHRTLPETASTCRSGRPHDRQNRPDRFQTGNHQRPENHILFPHHGRHPCQPEHDRTERVRPPCPGNISIPGPVMEALSRHFYLKLKQPLSSDDTLLYRLDRCICQTSALPRSRENTAFFRHWSDCGRIFFLKNRFRTSYLSRNYT